MQNKNGVDLIKVSLTRFQLASSFNFDGTRRVAMRWVAGPTVLVAVVWHNSGNLTSVIHPLHSGSKGDLFGTSAFFSPEDFFYRHPFC